MLFSLGPHPSSILSLFKSIENWDSGISEQTVDKHQFILFYFLKTGATNNTAQRTHFSKIYYLKNFEFMVRIKFSCLLYQWLLYLFFYLYVIPSCSLKMLPVFLLRWLLFQQCHLRLFYICWKFYNCFIMFGTPSIFLSREWDIHNVFTNVSYDL